MMEDILGAVEINPKTICKPDKHHITLKDNKSWAVYSSQHVLYINSD